MFSGGGKKDVDAFSTPAHQAPAGEGGNDPNVLEKFTTGEGANENVNETDTETKFEPTALTEWFKNDDNLVKFNRNAQLLVASCKMGLAHHRAAVFEAGILFVEQSVELVRPAEDSMEAVGQIMGAFGVRANVAKALVSFLLTGVPPAASVRDLILAGALAASNTLGDKDGLGGALADSVKAMTIPSPGTPGPGGPTTPMSISYARGELAKAPPDFYVQMDANLFGALAVNNPPFARMLNQAPLDRTAIQAAPLVTPEKARHIIKEALADSSKWPTLRYNLMNKLIALYGSCAGILIVQGENELAAATAGEEKVGTLLQEAIAGIPELGAQGLETVRSGAPSGADVLIAIDNQLAPDTPYPEQAWVMMAAAPGESTHALFIRIRKMAAQLNYPYPRSAEHLKRILQVLSLDMTNLDTSMAASNVLAHLTGAVEKCGDAASLDVILKHNGIYLRALVAESKGRRPPVLPPVPGTLATYPTKKFHDLSLIYKAYEEVTGKSLGALPPSRARGACNICATYGVEIVAYSDQLKEQMRGDTRRRFDHNEWGCVNLERFCKELVEKYPGKVVLDDILRVIDNPRDVARARGASA